MGRCVFQTPASTSTIQSARAIDVHEETWAPIHSTPPACLPSTTKQLQRAQSNPPRSEIRYARPSVQDVARYGFVMGPSRMQRAKVTVETHRKNRPGYVPGQVWMTKHDEDGSGTAASGRGGIQAPSTKHQTPNTKHQGLSARRWLGLCKRRKMIHGPGTPGYW